MVRRVLVEVCLMVVVKRERVEEVFIPGAMKILVAALCHHVRVAVVSGLGAALSVSRCIFTVFS